MTSPICIYTAITGSYNELLGHPSIDNTVWICFSDTLTDHPDWQIRKAESGGRRAAKPYKMRPDRYLPEFRRTIWIDGTVRVDSASFPHEAMAYADGSGIAMFRHPQRHDIWSEAVVSQSMPKYQNEPITEQILAYRASGIPHDTGLWAAGIIARDDESDLVRDLGAMWLDQIERWSVQDQLSLPYCLWRLGIEPGAFPQSLYENRWLSVMGHNPNF